MPRAAIKPISGQSQERRSSYVPPARFVGFCGVAYCVVDTASHLAYKLTKRPTNGVKMHCECYKNTYKIHSTPSTTAHPCSHASSFGRPVRMVWQNSSELSPFQKHPNFFLAQ